jgi:ferritin
MNTKLNDQITSEFGASHAYLAMSCRFGEMGLDGLAHYFRKQADEEREHALKIVDFIGEVGGTIALAPIPAPGKSFDKPIEAARIFLANEELVTRQINDLMALAEKESDYAARSFLQWFVDEQVEEIASAGKLIQLCEMAGSNLLQLDMAAARAAEN